MSETQSTEKAPKAKLTNTIIDLGLTWADMGLGLSKNALESTAHALESTAKRLEVLQGRLKTPRQGTTPAEEKPAGESAPKPANEVHAPSA
jgi:hypothetical protein